MHWPRPERPILAKCGLSRVGSTRGAISPAQCNVDDPRLYVQAHPCGAFPSLHLDAAKKARLLDYHGGPDPDYFRHRDRTSDARVLRWRSSVDSSSLPPDTGGHCSGASASAALATEARIPTNTTVATRTDS